VNSSLSLSSSLSSSGACLSLKGQSLANGFPESCPKTLDSYISLDLTATNISSGLPVLPYNNLSICEELNLSHNSLSVIPKFVYLLPCLRLLQLSSNCLEQIPSRLIQSETLEELYCDSNQLEVFPSSCSTTLTKKTLWSIRVLSLSNNRLTEISEAVCAIPNLEELNLENNLVKEIPTGLLSRASNLNILRLSHNEITSLPKTFGGLSNLEVFTIANNNLTELPQSFLLLSKLTFLDLSSNPFTDKELCRLTSRPAESLPQAQAVIQHIHQQAVAAKRGGPSRSQASSTLGVPGPLLSPTSSLRADNGSPRSLRPASAPRAGPQITRGKVNEPMIHADINELLMGYETLKKRSAAELIASLEAQSKADGNESEDEVSAQVENALRRIRSSGGVALHLRRSPLGSPAGSRGSSPEKSRSLGIRVHSAGTAGSRGSSPEKSRSVATSIFPAVKTPSDPRLGSPAGKPQSVSSTNRSSFPHLDSSLPASPHDSPRDPPHKLSLRCSTDAKDLRKVCGHNRSRSRDAKDLRTIVQSERLYGLSQDDLAEGLKKVQSKRQPPGSSSPSTLKMSLDSSKIARLLGTEERTSAPSSPKVRLSLASSIGSDKYSAPTSPSSSKERDFENEWFFSFSLKERLLMDELNGEGRMPLVLPDLPGFIYDDPSTQQLKVPVYFQAELTHSLFYRDKIFPFSHVNIFLRDSDQVEMVASIKKDAEPSTKLHLCLLRKPIGDVKHFISSDYFGGTGFGRKLSSQAMLKGIVKFFSQLMLSPPEAKLMPGTTVSEELMNLEQRLHVNRYKFGILLALEGQKTEESHFNNKDGTEHFDHFLSFIGEKVRLKGWDGYAGGLDVKGDTTGEYSYFTNFSGMDIMWHVSTLLPFDSFFGPDDMQLERKRHLGNDIVVVVFNEGTVPFDPSIVKSEFNHVFIVISPVKPKDSTDTSRYYRMEIVQKEGVPTIVPSLSPNAVYEENETFRKLLLYKLINSERCAYQGGRFGTMIKRTRESLIHDFSEYTK